MAQKTRPIVLRLPPKLADAIREESERRDVSMNWVITKALADLYGVDVRNVVRRATKKPREKEDECTPGSQKQPP